MESAEKNELFFLSRKLASASGWLLWVISSRSDYTAWASAFRGKADARERHVLAELRHLGSICYDIKSDGVNYFVTELIFQVHSWFAVIKFQTARYRNQGVTLLYPPYRSLIVSN